MFLQISSKKTKARQLLPLIFNFAEVLLVAKTSLWEGQYGTMRSDLELAGTFRFFAFLLLILFDGPWHAKACSEFEKDFQTNRLDYHLIKSRLLENLKDRQIYNVGHCFSQYLNKLLGCVCRVLAPM